jgi:hypothetical protein
MRLNPANTPPRWRGFLRARKVFVETPVHEMEFPHLEEFVSSATQVDFAVTLGGVGASGRAGLSGRVEAARSQGSGAGAASALR